MKMESREYPGIQLEVPRLIAELYAFFNTKDYEVQTREVSSSSVIQVRKTNVWRDFSGLSYALTIVVASEGGKARVEIGGQRWLDKAGVGAVTMFIAWPLMAIPVLGAYWQHKLVENTWDIIEKHVAQAGPGSCPRCGVPAPAGSTFCPNCAFGLKRQTQCPSCGKAISQPPGRFCNHCAKPLADGNQV